MKESNKEYLDHAPDDLEVMIANGIRSLKKMGFSTNKASEAINSSTYLPYHFELDELVELFRNDKEHWSMTMFESYVKKDNYEYVTIMLLFLEHYNVSKIFRTKIIKKYFRFGVIKLRPTSKFSVKDPASDFYPKLSELLKKYTSIKNKEIVDLIYNNFDVGSATKGSINQYIKPSSKIE